VTIAGKKPRTAGLPGEAGKKPRDAGLTGAAGLPGDAGKRPRAAGLPRVVGGASAWAIAVGGLTLLGYGLDVPILARPVAGGAFMVPETAVAFIAAGAGLWLVAPVATLTADGRPGPGAGRRRRAGQVLGLLVALLAATVLIEYATGRSAGIDLLLFPGRLRAWTTHGALGRPSPYAGVAFLCTGLALALLDADAGHRHRPARVLVPATALVACVALIGYVFGVQDLRYGNHQISGLALSSMITFVLLAVGILACRPDRPPAHVFTGRGPGAAATRRMVPVVTAALLIAVLVTVIGRSGLAIGEGLAAAAAVTTVMVTLYLVFLRAGAALDRAGRALSDERDFSQTVVRSLREGVITTGPDGEVLQVNPRWCEITGLPAQDVIGLRPPYPWWSPGEVADRTAQFASLLTAEAEVESDMVIRRPDGTKIEVLTTAAPVRNEAGLRMIVATYRDLTERNRAADEARRAAEQLDHFFDISTDLLCIAGTDGYFKRLNPAWERTFGYTIAELCARPYLEFIHPEDVSRTSSEAAEQAADGKITVAFDNRYRCRDGSYRWLSWNATPIPDSDMVYAVARDNTEQRQADQARALLAAIVDGTDDATIGMTLDGTIVSWNPAAERNYGYQSADAIGQSMGLVTAPDRPAEMAEMLDRVARGIPVTHHNTVRLRKDGIQRQVEVTISPIRDSAGTVVAAASIARDITDRLKAEERFRRLVLAAPDAMVIVDSSGRIALVNEQTERLFGYPADELVGQPVELLVPRQLRDRHAGHRHGYFAAPQVRRMGAGLELSGLRRDGTEFPIEISLAPLDTDEGTMASASIRDISERRHVEQALASARDEALAAAQLKSQFVAMVSHEIRTPMNGVIGLTALLLDTPLQPAQQRYAQAIRTSGRALLTIINDILDFSKIEAGKIIIVEADFELDELLESVVQVAAQAGRDKELEIVGYYPPGLPVAVRGDAGRLRQALLNLLGNAVKFTEHGEVLIRATPVTSAPASGPQVTFAVIDTGIGIAPRDLPLLFSAFAQVDASANRQFGGTGLGLPIASQLVELMGGQLDVRSQPGQGSQFSFTIPLAPQASPAARRDRASSCLSARRLLIVDDNATCRQLIREHAGAWGMDPTAVADGGTALELLRYAAEHRQPFAVAVIDQHMPGLSGVHLAQQIIADPALAATKLVLLTSGSYQDDEAAAAAGAVAVLPKPLCPSQIYNCLLGLLDPDAAATAKQAQSAPDRGRASADRGLVLLAEDNEINQMVAADNLSMLGYRVDIARNGLEAVRLASTKPYDAILMDCQMPKMDGYAAAAQLRRQERPGQRIPIIAMTAGALAEDRQRCLAAGMDDYLTKPVDPEQLRAALSRWITAATVPPAASAPPAAASR
jgi:PAS domain S-box-containing protein